MGSNSIVFGPVHSRRLGVSLGINNIPYKICSYTCVYCQVGRTLKLSVERRPYSDPARLVDEVARALEAAGSVDYVTFVPDGEPTLDSNLGRAIRLLKRELSVRVAVLTNASLLFEEDVRRDLGEADLVSLKVDAGKRSTWKRINRPHPLLEFDTVTKGIMGFAGEYDGILITETMLVKGINDDSIELEHIASLLERISPRTAYIAVPHRPPAEEWVSPPPLETVLRAYQLLVEKGVNASILAYPEPPPPPPAHASLEEWVRSTVRVHPLPLDYLERLAGERRVSLGELLARLESEGFTVVEYSGRRFLAYRPRAR